MGRGRAPVRRALAPLPRDRRRRRPRPSPRRVRAQCRNYVHYGRETRSCSPGHVLFPPTSVGCGGACRQQNSPLPPRSRCHRASRTPSRWARRLAADDALTVAPRSGRGLTAWPTSACSAWASTPTARTPSSPGSPTASSAAAPPLTTPGRAPPRRPSGSRFDRWSVESGASRLNRSAVELSGHLEHGRAGARRQGRQGLVAQLDES